MQFTINVCHDEADGVWLVESSDVPGLNAEAGTLDELVEVITEIAPELAAATVPRPAGQDNAITFCVQHIVNTGRARAA